MSVSGNLATMELQELLQWVSQFRKKGALVIRHGEYQRQLYFEAGRLVACASTDPSETLAAYLVQQDLVSREDVRRAAEAVKPHRNQELGRVLVESGVLGETVLREALTARIEQHVIEILSWSEGEFRFIQDLESEKRFARVAVDVTELLLRAAHQMDLMRAKATRTVSPVGFEDVLGTSAFGQAESLPLEGSGPAQQATGGGALAAAPHDSEPPVSRPARAPSLELTGSIPTRRRLASPVQAAILVLLAVGLLVATWWLVPSKIDKEATGNVATEQGNDSGTVTALVQPGGLVEGFLDEEGLSEDDGTSHGGAAFAQAKSELEEARRVEELELLVSQRSAEAAESVRAEYDRRIVELERELAEAKKATSEATAQEATRVRSLQALVDAEGGNGGPPQKVSARDQAAGEKPESKADEVAGGFSTAQGRLSPATTQPARADASLRNESSDESDEGLGAKPPVEMATGSQTLLEPGSSINDGPLAVSEPKNVGSAGLKPARLARPIRPTYPPQAKRLSKSAEVLVKVRVEADGRVSQAETVGSPVGFGMDQAALEAVRASFWEAGERDGQAVASWAHIRVSFKPY